MDIERHVQAIQSDLATAAALGDEAAAQQERREVANILAAVEKGVPESLRPRFLLRPDVRALSQ